MGCDIHAFVEAKRNNHWEFVTRWLLESTEFGPMSICSYRIFGFLAHVRNYSLSPVIAPPRGIPSDISVGVKRLWEQWIGDAHSASWLTRKELLNYDYATTFEDRRTTIRIGNNHFDGGQQCIPGDGRIVELGEWLGKGYFENLNALTKIPDKDVRVVFWFDN